MQVGPLVSRKAKHVGQVLLRRNAFYSSAGDLRRWQTLVFKNHLNISVQVQVFIGRKRENRTKTSGSGVVVLVSFHKDVGVASSCGQAAPGPGRIQNSRFLD